MMAKFSDIQLFDGKLLGGYILLLDGKYSRQNKHKIGFTERYTKAPIFPELYEFLHYCPIKINITLFDYLTN